MKMNMNRMNMNREDLLIFTSILLFIQGYLFVNIIPPLLGIGILLFLLSLRFSFNPVIYYDINILNKDVYENEYVEVLFKIENKSKIPLKIKIFVNDKNFISESKEVLLKSKETKEVLIKLKPKKKGSFNIKNFILKVYDIYNIHCDEIQVNSKFYVNVYPSLNSIKKDIKMDRNTKLTPLKVGINSFEIETLKEYQPGDNIKFIDWKATAKTGKLIVREFLKENEGDVYILVDVSKEFLKDISSKKSKIDYLTLLLSNLVYNLNLKKINFKIILFDNIGVKKIIKNPKDVKFIKEVNAYKINLRFLLSIFKKSFNGLALTSNNIKSGSFAIIITDAGLWGDELIKVISNLKRKNVKICIISLNSILFIDENSLNNYNLPKLYKKFVERKEIIKKIRAICPIVDVGPKDLVDKVLKEIK